MKRGGGREKGKQNKSTKRIKERERVNNLTKRREFAETKVAAKLHYKETQKQCNMFISKLRQRQKCSHYDSQLAVI